MASELTLSSPQVQRRRPTFGPLGTRQRDPKRQVTQLSSKHKLLFVFVSPLRLSKKPGDNKAKKSKQVSQKYTASRLHEKGVLIAIEDLQPNQSVHSPRTAAQLMALTSSVSTRLLFSPHRFKNVIFEISPSEAVGVFDVKAKLMGVHLETLQIEYQV